MGYLGTKPANQITDSTLIADGTITTADLASGLTVNFADGSASTPSITNDGDTNTGIFFPAADTIAFAEGGVESMRIDSSGNVGIGTSSILAKTQIQVGDVMPAGSGNMNTGVVIQQSGVGQALNFGSSSTNGYSWINSAYSNNSGIAAPLVLMTGATERMRIDSSGRVQIGTTNTNPSISNNFGVVIGSGGDGNAYAGVIQASSNGSSALILNRGGDNGNTVAFFRSGTNVGTISVTTSSTSYNTSSDYRLKENIAPMTGALAVVGQLKPCTYTWKTDGSQGQGFIAHELQEVVPECVTGEKDAVNEDGSIKAQGIDTSFLVATLTAAIQELKAELDIVKAEVTALKGTE